MGILGACTEAMEALAALSKSSAQSSIDSRAYALKLSFVCHLNIAWTVDGWTLHLSKCVANETRAACQVYSFALIGPTISVMALYIAVAISTHRTGEPVWSTNTGDPGPRELSPTSSAKSLRAAAALRGSSWKGMYSGCAPQTD
jgi:hypothetical protein